MSQNTSVGVIVLGDIGRSPRMQYHSYSLKKEGFKVKVLGYDETKVSNYLLEDVEIVNVKQLPNLSIPRLLHFVIKVLWNAVFLFYALLMNGRFHTLLVQNPPSIPTLFVCFIYCKIFRTQFIIDWHNYAYTIMALSIGRNHFLVRISEVFERYAGRLADKNLCVSKAMANDLKIKWSIDSTTLYDKPGPRMISEISKTDKLSFFEKLSTEYKEFELLLKNDCSALLVSSTSWTEDEDFSILFDALIDYDRTECDELPSLLCVITGKGPLKSHYLHEIAKIRWNKVKIVTPWLEADDYPRLLVSADLGVCLHTSSSGLDLPMKIVDMFGSTLPVCAYDYPCLSELVRHNENGLVFENSAQLAGQIKDWFINFPEVQSRHIQFRDNIRKSMKMDWHCNWKENAMPLFSN